MNEDQKIRAIWGAEPVRDQEGCEAYVIGFKGVTSIVRRVENLGTYGMVWFDVFAGEQRIQSMNASFVASIAYVKAEVAP